MSYIYAKWEFYNKVRWRAELAMLFMKLHAKFCENDYHDGC